MKKLKTIRFKSADSIIRKYISLTFGSKLSKSRYGIGTMDEKGNIQEITVDEMISAIKPIGVWGFTDTKTRKIYFWADRNAVKRKLIEFFAHEIGHNSGKKCADVVKEEMRADEYANVATLAFDMANKLKN